MHRDLSAVERGVTMIYFYQFYSVISLIFTSASGLSMEFFRGLGFKSPTGSRTDDSTVRIEVQDPDVTLEDTDREEENSGSTSFQPASPPRSP